MFLVHIPIYKPADLPRFAHNNLGRGELPRVKASQIFREIFFLPTRYYH